MYFEQERIEDAELCSDVTVFLCLAFSSFHVLQLRHDNDADDDEQEPRTDFAKADGLPYFLLVGIFPGAEKCCDVFS